MNSFSRRIRQRAQNVATNADRAMRMTALTVDATVVLATPVDTGRARSNWVVQLDSASENEIDAYSPGTALGTSEGANARAALEQGKRVIGDYNGDVNNAIHITNNLKYIARLNEGWSAQAPVGFVEQAIDNGIATLRQAGFKLLDRK